MRLRRIWKWSQTGWWLLTRTRSSMTWKVKNGNGRVACQRGPLCELRVQSRDRRSGHREPSGDGGGIAKVRRSCSSDASRGRLWQESAKQTSSSWVLLGKGHFEDGVQWVETTDLLCPPNWYRKRTCCRVSPGAANALHNSRILAEAIAFTWWFISTGQTQWWQGWWEPCHLVQRVCEDDWCQQKSLGLYKTNASVSGHFGPIGAYREQPLLPDKFRRLERPYGLEAPFAEESVLKLVSKEAPPSMPVGAPELAQITLDAVPAVASKDWTREARNEHVEGLKAALIAVLRKRNLDTWSIQLEGPIAAAARRQEWRDWLQEWNEWEKDAKFEVKYPMFKRGERMTHTEAELRSMKLLLHTQGAVARQPNWDVLVATRKVALALCISARIRTGACRLPDLFNSRALQVQQGQIDPFDLWPQWNDMNFFSS